MRFTPASASVATNTSETFMAQPPQRVYGYLDSFFREWFSTITGC
jgi:hypothetical protein